MKKIITYIVIVLLVIALGVIAYLMTKSSSNNLSQKSLIHASTLESLDKKDASSAYLDRIGDDVIPPTNSWISGMILQETPNPVFPMPNSFKATDDGFELGLPTITSQSEVITGGHTPGISATILGATDFSLERFDDVSATLAYSQDDDILGGMTIASGSPYVFYEAQQDSAITISDITAISSESSDTYLRFEKNQKTFAIATHNGAMINADVASAEITLPSDGLATFYSLPDGDSDDLRQYSANVLESVKTSYDSENETIITKLDYQTKNNQPTVLSPMNYHDVDGNSIGANYDSTYGPMRIFAGNVFDLSAPRIDTSNQLDVESLSMEQKEEIRNTLRQDANDAEVVAEDSYFAGKQLAQIANLLDIANQLDEEQIAQNLQSKLNQAFDVRLSSAYFYYDSELKGIAAETAAFGSEDFNDHHFHYGYFLYAASILARYDDSFLDDHEDFVNLLAADIAEYDDSSDFPVRRNFDPYASHSWAAGLSPFADGNNQESSSEAIQAWNGVALWGEVTNNQSLRDSGEWMLAHETQTATEGWRNIKPEGAGLENYDSPVSSLNFGGKRTYSTFFSDEANTKLAIQLLPLNPMMTTFARDGDDIERLVSASITDNNFNVALGDYIVMYLALSDPDAALAAAQAQDDEFIDDGNSRTYMNAWIYTQMSE